MRACVLGVACKADAGEAATPLKLQWYSDGLEEVSGLYAMRCKGISALTNSQVVSYPTEVIKGLGLQCHSPVTHWSSRSFPRYARLEESVC